MNCSLPKLWCALGLSLSIYAPPTLAETLAHPPKTITRLVEATADRLAGDLLATVCAQLSVPCALSSTKAWVQAQRSDSPLYLTDTSTLMMVMLDKTTPADTQRAQVWMLGGFQHSQSDHDGLNAQVLEIYPALYPLPQSTDGAFAIAIVAKKSEMYSGGGAFLSIADFVALHTKPAETGLSWSRAYSAVPFSCSKMVRACFAEKEYQKSRHCHDEYDGTLQIILPAAASTRKDWTFVWRETEWPAHVAKSKTQSTRTKFTLPFGEPKSWPAQLPDAVPFCGGGQG
jgi:hypothetical protein